MCWLNNNSNHSQRYDLLPNGDLLRKNDQNHEQREKGVGVRACVRACSHWVKRERIKEQQLNM